VRVNRPFRQAQGEDSPPARVILWPQFLVRCLGHKKIRTLPCHRGFRGWTCRGPEHIFYITRLSRKGKSSCTSGAIAQKPRPAGTGKASGRRGHAPAHAWSRPPGRVGRRGRAITGSPTLKAAGKSCWQQASWPASTRSARGMASSRVSLAETADSGPRGGSSARSIFPVRLSTRRWRLDQLTLAWRPVREGARAGKPGFPAARPALGARPLHLHLRAYEQRR